MKIFWIKEYAMSFIRQLHLGVEEQIFRKTVLVMLAALILAGCVFAPESAATPTDLTATALNLTDVLEETSWRLETLTGNSLIQETRINLNFVNGFINGFAGCNKYESVVIEDDPDAHKYLATENGTLIIKGFMVTEKDCPTPGGLMRQEQAYLAALSDSARYQIMGDNLVLYNEAGEEMLVFRRVGN